VGGGGMFIDRSITWLKSTLGAATKVPAAPRPSSSWRRRASP
jgi:hypothetical protein